MTGHTAGVEWRCRHSGRDGLAGAVASAGGTGSTRYGASGGNVVNVTIDSSSTGSHYIGAGDGAMGQTRGGAGGYISAARANAVGFIQAQGGIGGDADLGPGGNGGTVMRSSFISGNGDVSVYGGGGGAGGPRRGLGGALIGLTTQAGLHDTVYLYGGYAGAALGSGAGLTGARGGSILSQTILGAESVIIEAGPGGDVPWGTGLAGQGGNVTGLNARRLPGMSVQYIVAGRGGYANVGTGGSITGVTVNGYVGSRAGSYGLGGLFAGLGGAGTAADGVNGSVVGVTARGISAIAAGYPTSPAYYLTDIYTASRVGNITADYVGIDVDADSIFDYNDNDTSGTYTLGDEPLDGYIQADSVFNIRNSRGIALVPVVYP